MPELLNTPRFKKIRGVDLRAMQKSALIWYREKLKLASGKREVFPEDIMKGRRDAKKSLQIGQFCLFRYDAKHKNDAKILSYWDSYPLSIILDIKEDHFLSVNFHYMAPEFRYLIFYRLLELIKGDKMDDKSKAAITYALIKSNAKFHWMQPCIKMHLFSQIRSKIIRINPVEMENAIFIPNIEMWNKGGTGGFISRNKVWADSKRAISGRKLG